MPIAAKILPLISTTEIGSLPFHNVDVAIQHAFGVSIPFLPQIPIRNPKEFMLSQALEGLPGLELDQDGHPLIYFSKWESGALAFQEKIESALDRARQDRNALTDFLPTPESSRAWQPFLWELKERGVRLAKIQIAGPLTSQWVLRTDHGQNADREAGLGNQIFKLILVRALAMSRELQNRGVQPILFLDEPGLGVFNPKNIRHILSLQELRLLVLTLQKEGILVGLHSCSETEWAQVLEIPWDILSVDSFLSLDSLLKEHAAKIRALLARGGVLSLGVLPTSNSIAANTPLIRVLLERVRAFTPASHPLILTPACGLALLKPDEAQDILGRLQNISKEAAMSL